MIDTPAVCGRIFFGRRIAFYRIDRYNILANNIGGVFYECYEKVSC